MKKIYIVFFFLVIGKSFGQVLQNANWIFGYGVGVTFNTTPPSALTPLPPALGFDVVEGSATVSDNDGNLLLFTDGETVWLRLPDGSNEVVATGLFGEESSSQNAVIVHKPGSPNNYYIFTIKGGTSDLKHRGLYYSEIEVNYPYASLVFKNKILKDDLGILINEDWGNVAEALTATTHSDNYQYWVEAFVGDGIGSGKILSYLVTENGVIDEVPQSVEEFPVEAFSFCLKVSEGHIALGTEFSGVYLGTFDNSSGIVYIDTSAPVGNLSGMSYSVEFSKSGQNLYFINSNSDYLLGVNVNQPQTLTTYNQVGFPKRLQIGMDDNIYIINALTNTALSALSNPNNLINPGYLSNYVSFSSYCMDGLPQLVPIQVWHGPCINVLNVEIDAFAPDIDSQQAFNLLKAKNTVYSGATATYHAGSTVLLTSGFHAKNGSKFRGYIEGCSGESAGRMAYDQEEKTKNFEYDEIKKLKIYPNPSASTTEITMPNAEIAQLTIFSIDGRMIRNIKMDAKEVYQLDVSDLLKGMYILSVEMTDGKIYSEKLIKN